MDCPRFEARLLEALSPGQLVRGAPLAPLTTFGLGGPADWLVDAGTEDDLRLVLAAAAEAGAEVTMLGGGSNVVVADAGIRGVVVRLRLRTISRLADARVRAGAGVTINGLVRWMVGRGLAGLEAWAGTPGTVGGAVYGNAHWQGAPISDHVAVVRLMARDGRLLTVEASEMAFGYDTSRLQSSHEILVSADFAVTEADPSALRRVARESLAYRKATQPLASPSAGCMFQNPDPARDVLPADMPPSAGALIDRAGLKGYRIGGAAISERHANFIVTNASATAADVRAVVEAARRVIRDRFGIDLRDEVVFLGTF
jgi:UDP-N-acetylmuramate dehydrogenase